MAQPPPTLPGPDGGGAESELWRNSGGHIGEDQEIAKETGPVADDEPPETIGIAPPPAYSDVSRPVADNGMGGAGEEVRDDPRERPADAAPADRELSLEREDGREDNETQSSGKDEGTDAGDGAEGTAVDEEGEMAAKEGDDPEAGRSPEGETKKADDGNDGSGEILSGNAGGAGGDEPKVDQEKLQAERLRLKELVHKFVARALAGSPCTLLAEAGRTNTKYCIDSSLETFLLVSAEDMSHTLIACRIANIEDVYSVADDGMAPFPQPILGLLQQTELPQLLMIVFRGPQNRLYRFCILEESDKTCATFMEAMSCLHMYAQPQAERLRQQVVAEHAKLHGGKNSDADLSLVASRAADAALAQQASVGFFLRCAGVRGGRGALGALKCKAMKLSRQVTISPLSPDQVAGYLGAYGFAAQSATAWRITPSIMGLGALPKLEIGVTQHIEVAGHTWYMVECTMALTSGGQKHPKLEWQVPRRLAHLRHDLHDPVKAALGKNYHKHFSGSRFARAGGVPGTTAALHKWSHALAHVIRSGSAQPILVALVLRFLEAPSPELPRDALQ